jgi:FtsP/CotA-like multicopper oxidase with cupredoxin domain
MKQSLRAILPLILPLIVVAIVLSSCDLFGSSDSSSSGPASQPTSATSGLLPGETPGVLSPINPAADHAMEPLPIEGVPEATETEGGQPLAYEMDGDVKVFRLTATAVRWHILKDVVVTALTYNGMVPGPLIRVTEGDKLRVILKNEMSDPTTIHWHGMIVPNNMDGVPGMTQPPIQPGESFTYEFTAKIPGSYWYHSHFESDRQIGVGLHAPIIIDPIVAEASPPDVDKVLMIEEWRIIKGETIPSMPASGMDANFFTINGKAYPDTPEIMLKQGQKLRLRLVGAGQLGHPIHIHGPAFKITATDGHDVPEAAQLTKDTVWVAPGERYDIEWVASEPGVWMLHCHIPHHTTNDHEEPGGLMMMIHVEP